MKTILYYISFIFFSTEILAQGNFTTEWESPPGLSFTEIIQAERNNSIPDIVF